ncbi:MAG: hypothetical protein KC652_08015 [Cyanobacteria bacterium HKST-UBA01]|nr:hypothetical protein [Cyanobacteria bacterium HKST-UBA01]
MTNLPQSIKKKLKSYINGLLGRKDEVGRDDQEPDSATICCGGAVHIAYRGLSDDRMYISYDRKWEEVRFFRQNSLRVFCAGCRQRIYSSEDTES